MLASVFNNGRSSCLLGKCDLCISFVLPLCLLMKAIRRLSSDSCAAEALEEESFESVDGAPSVSACPAHLRSHFGLNRECSTQALAIELVNKISFFFWRILNKASPGLWIESRTLIPRRVHRGSVRISWLLAEANPNRILT